MFDFSTVKEVALSSGAHKRPEEGMCFMEMAAWFAGEEHSDRPQCVSPALGMLGIHLNDTMPPDLRDATLKPMIPHVVGTKDGAHEQRRVEYICVRAFNYGAGILCPELIRRSHGARSLGEARSMMEHIEHLPQPRDYRRGGLEYSDHAYGYVVWDEHRTLAQHLRDMFRHHADLQEPLFSVSKTSAVSMAKYDYPSGGNARSAAAVFASMAAIIPDWSAGIDTLREAIKLGRHDGFDESARLDKRHEALRELVERRRRTPEWVA